MMSTFPDSPLLLESVKRSKSDKSHHVTAPPTTSSSFLSWISSPPVAVANENTTATPGPTFFRNPWRSWQAPSRAKVWEHLQWGEDQDPSIPLATAQLDDLPVPSQAPEERHRPRFGDSGNCPDSTGAKAARLLGIQVPDFSFDAPSPDVKAKATWLGHACMLAEFPLPSTSQNERPIRCLFDPMFSMRCSPSQTMGPVRSYPPPCAVDALPAIDAVFISHNHYDHLDHDTIKSLWECNKDTIRFFVPLGNQRWFIESGIDPDCVTEMDWWDCAYLVPRSQASESQRLKIWCTPAQHNSGRIGYEANSTLWSGWFIEHCTPERTPYRVFFAGDTGYQFHSSPAWPFDLTEEDSPSASDDEDKTSPPCPAFEEIRERLGPPDLLLIPIWVGATFSYLRSFVPLPDWISPFPRHSVGLSGANHMPPWDAVKVAKLMTQQGRVGKKSYRPVAVAVHWGTFVTDPAEVFKTLGQLEWACQKQGVRFARSLLPAEVEEGNNSDVGQDDLGGKVGTELYFLALNHGQSVYT